MLTFTRHLLLHSSLSRNSFELVRYKKLTRSNTGSSEALPVSPTEATPPEDLDATLLESLTHERDASSAEVSRPSSVAVFSRQDSSLAIGSLHVASQVGSPENNKFEHRRSTCIDSALPTDVLVFRKRSNSLEVLRTENVGDEEGKYFRSSITSRL